MSLTSKKAKVRSPRVRAQEPRPVDLDVLPTLLGFNIRRAQIALWRDFAHSVGEGEIRPGAFSLMLLVSANPGIAQIDIANQLGVDKATVVALIDRLESEGWMSRTRSSEDRRRQNIRLTPEGTKVYKMLRKQMIEHERKFVERFTPQELRTLISLLKRLHG
jgi:DNA-binding MarR family transcriptional regulator